MLKTETVKVISCHDWDSFVQETYGKIYTFQQQDGCKSRGIERITVPDEYDEWDFENTEIPFVVNGEEMGVSFDTWLNTSDENTLKHFHNNEFENRLFWERNFYPEVNTLANDLFLRGLMEPGEYIIIIDW